MTVLIDAEQQPLRSISLAEPLSSQLREATSTLHLHVEQILGLPGAIRQRADYVRCLSRFYGLYQPLEAMLASFHAWPAAGIDIAACTQSGKLAEDLRTLGVEAAQLETAPHRSLPLLPDFAHALGALYVLEGSTLGSQYILPRLVEQMGTQLLGATSFFFGRGAQTGRCWKHFREALDHYGLRFPENRTAVVQGAQACFGSIGIWMQT